MDLIPRIIINLICGPLFAWGGFDWLPARRYIMPVFIACGVCIATHTWWTGFMVLPVIGTLCLGYSGSKWAWRGGWMALQALVIGLGLFLTKHLVWYFYAPYVAIAAILGATLYDIEQLIGDAIFGCWLGSIVLWARP